MISFIIIAKGFNRHTNIYNSLCASAFLMLLFNPFLIMNVGFQLSYAAVFGIIFFQPLVYRLIIIQNRLLNHFWQVVSVSIAAQIATLPLTIYYFHQFPVYFWLSGLVVIDGAFIIMMLGLVLFISEPISSIIAEQTGFILDRTVHFINYFLECIEKLPITLLRGLWIGLEAMILLYVLIYLIGHLLKIRSKLLVYSAICLTLLFFTLTSFDRINEGSRDFVVIYFDNRTFMMDVFYGDQLVAFQEEDAKESSKYYAREPLRSFKGTMIDTTLLWSRDSLFQNRFLSRKGMFLQVSDMKIVVIDETINLRKSKKSVEVDIIMLKGKKLPMFQDLMNCFKFKEIVLSANIPSKISASIVRECQQSKIKCYDVKTNGAFLIDI